MNRPPVLAMLAALAAGGPIVELPSGLRMERFSPGTPKARRPVAAGPGSLAEYDAQMSAWLRGERMYRPDRRVRKALA